MDADYRPARRAWLAAITLGHLAMLAAWRPVPRLRAAPGARPEGELVLMTLAPARRPAEAPPRPPAWQQQTARPPRPAAAQPAPLATELPRPDAPAAAAEASPHSITLLARAAADPADPFAKPAPLAETLLEKNRKLAAGVDRQLRKESLNKFATLVNEDSAAALSISGVTPPPMAGAETYAGANGIIHKRYMLRGQMVCEEVDHIGVAGHDVFRNGSKARLVKCPK